MATSFSCSAPARFAPGWRTAVEAGTFAFEFAIVAAIGSGTVLTSITAAVVFAA